MNKTNLQFIGLLLLTLLLASCSREDRFENWLTKKDGNWEIKTMQETLVYYNGADSTVSPTSDSTDVAGIFIFDRNGSYEYNFSSLALNFGFGSGGEELIEGETFSHVQAGNGFADEAEKYWVFGEKISNRQLRVLMRVEWWNLSGIYLAANYVMVLERAN
jgi:hypothetical protein